jgi:predicted PurR-regulated permease PerM
VRLAAALAASLGLLLVLRQLLHPLALLFAAVVIADAVQPIVAWLERWLPRTLSIVLVYLLALAVVAAILWWVLPTLLTEAASVFVRLPGMLDRARGVLARVAPPGADGVVDALRSRLVGLGSGLLSLPMLVFSAAVEIVLVVVMSIYWLVVSPALYDFALSLVPQSQRARTREILGEMSSTMGGFIRATVIDGLLVGAITYVGLLIIGVEFPLVLAAVAGVGELIPMVGPILAGVPAVAIAFLDGSRTEAVVVLLFYIAVQQVENHLLVPYIMHKQANIPPLLAIFALSAGAWLGGALWALIAIPLAGALRVLVVQLIVPLVRSRTGSSDGEPPPQDRRGPARIAATSPTERPDSSGPPPEDP